VERDGAEWNKYSAPLFGYFQKEKTKLMVSGGIMLNSSHLIPFRSAQFHYYFSNPNNRTLLYSILFRSIPLYSTNPNGA
jgi:hypothetical protein